MPARKKASDRAVMTVPLVEPLEQRRLLAATTFRINAGGGVFVEASGKTWKADGYFTGGAVSAGAGGDIAGTENDALFASRRVGDFAYAFPLRNGSYRVKLLFCDLEFSTPQQRLFHVLAEKKTVLKRCDIAAAGGGPNAAVTKSFSVTVSDGRLNLWFQGIRNAAIVSAIELRPLPSPAPWKALAPAPLARFEGQSEVVNRELFVFGGFVSDDGAATHQAHAYNADTNTWRRMADVPLAQTHTASAVDGAFVYLAGGYVGPWMGSHTPVSRGVFRYDTVANTWTSLRPLPGARAAGALVRVGRKLHFFGGVDENLRDSGVHWELDLRRPTKWVERAPLPNPRNHLGYALLGTRIYAIGGQHRMREEDDNVADVHAFDVLTGAWSQVASLPQPRSHTHNSSFTMRGRLIVAGGATNGSVTLADLLEYDPAADKWSSIAQLPELRDAPSVKRLDEFVIVTGGKNQGYPLGSDTWTRRFMHTLTSGFSETTVAKLNTKVAATMAFAPDGRLFVADSTRGQIRVVKNETLRTEPAITLTVDAARERGINGIAFAPDFATAPPGKQYVFVFYTRPDPARPNVNPSNARNRLSRFTVSASNADMLEPASELALLDNIDASAGDHNGGALHFGDDGMLYLAIGDASVKSNAQDLSNLNGKVLRLDAMDPTHLIPDDNPFINRPGARGEIWAYGLRNPFTGGFKPGSGLLYINDVGDSRFEEIDSIKRGLNYGWPLSEGITDLSGQENPVFTYARESQGAAIAGGAFYNGNSFPAQYVGKLFFGDFVRKTIWTLDETTGKAVPFLAGTLGIVDIDVNPVDGSLWYLDLTGQVQRIQSVVATTEGL